MNEYAEPTEMAGVAEAETQAAYAWALDYDDPDEFSTQPIQRLTSRHITALSLAASLVLIAMASVVALVVPSPKPSEPVVAAPSPVTVTAAPTTSTAQIHSGPSIGDECYDWMKFSTDRLSEQEMICSGYSENLSRGDPMTWFSAEEGAVGPSAGWADAPRVGRTGSSCTGEVPFTTGRSSDGYAVWCFGGPGSYMPGTKPIWTVYRP
jgi:hypothetical protein